MLQCSVFCRDAWLASGGLDPRFRLMHDPDLFFRLSIGQKICAVSGVACFQTDDDASNVRLTTAVHPEGVAYWKKAIALRKRLWRLFPNLPAKYRSVLRLDLASAHWRLFCVHWSSRRLAKAAWRLAIVGFAHPLFFFSLLVYRSSRPKRRRVGVEY